jgi:protocatechuate 3,4-dioxygenase beta subunit
MRRSFPAALAVVVLGGSLLAGPDQVVVMNDSLVRENPAPPRGTGVLLGRVIESSSNRPVAGAVVTPRLGATALEPVLTDAQGRFVLRDLATGELTLSAAKPGYVNGKYGKHLPDTGLDVNTDFQTIDLADDARMTDVVIALWKHASIAGRVTDERDDPIVGITVRALRASYTGGRRRFETSGPSATALTDDRGMYRFSGLIPGEYVVVVPIVSTTWPQALQRLLASPQAEAPPGFSDSVTSSGRWRGPTSLNRSALSAHDDRFAFSVTDSFTHLAGVASDGRLLTYDTQYYPGAPVLSRAAVIAVASGEERVGVDVRLRPTATVRVSGRLSGPDGAGPNILVRLVPADATSLSDDPELNAAIADEHGAFTLLGVVPGDYVLKALVTPRPRQAALERPGAPAVRTGAGGGGVVVVSTDRPSPLPVDPMLWAEQPIVVGDRDVSDIALTLRAGARLMGRVEFDGPPDAPKPSLSSVYIERADGSQSVNLNLLLARIDAQYDFSSFGQVPGRYFVRAPWTVPGWYFEGAMLGDRNLSVVPIELGSEDVAGIVLKYTKEPPAELSGTVRTNATPAPYGSSVIVFPVDRTAWDELGQNPPHVQSAAVVAGGRYRVKGLPPGTYFAAATPDARIDWPEPRRLAALVTGATRVEIRRGERRTLDLVLPTRRGSVASSDDVQIADSFALCGDVPDSMSSPQARDVRPPPPAGSAVIAGTIVADADGTPIRRVQVMLTGSTPLGRWVTVTDDAGRFAFAGVPAGRFTLAAAKAPFIAATYGASRPGRPGTPITVTDGERVADLRLALVRGAVLAGVITDSEGQPIVGAMVRPVRYVTANGVRRLRAVDPTTVMTPVTTDDRGAYRIHGLEPGEYSVGVSVRAGAPSARPTTEADVQFALSALGSPTVGGRGQAATTRPPELALPVAFVPILYPGTADPSAAVMVRVGPGEERAGLNFVVTPVPAATVSGVVTGPGGETPSGTEVRLVNVGETVTINPFEGVSSGLPQRPLPTGAFSFSGVPPGRYAIVAATGGSGRRGAPAPPADAFLWAISEVVVAGRNVPDVAVALQPGLPVTGRIRFDATTLSPPAGDAVRVSLNPVLAASQVSVGQLTSYATDGSFALAVMPGRYQPRAFLPAGTTGWLLSSALIGDRDVADEGFDVRLGDPPVALTLVFTDRPAELSGVLQDASGRPAPDYFIILFPADAAKWRAGARRIQQVRPGTDGRYVVRNLLAGEYRLAALTDVAPGDAFDPAFLETLVPHAIALTIGEGERKVQDIRIGAR